MGNSKTEHMMENNKLEAASSLFDSRMNHKAPELRFRSIFSELDITTKNTVVWDLWIRFPFKIKKEDNEKFKAAIQELFKTTLLRK